MCLGRPKLKPPSEKRKKKHRQTKIRVKIAQHWGKKVFTGWGEPSLTTKKGTQATEEGGGKQKGRVRGGAKKFGRRRRN